MNKQREYKLNYLSAEFYARYNNAEYPEIENKDNRPYMVLLIEISNNTFAIPFRTNIKHNSCYKFKNSTRPTNTVTGLDYTKAVIVNDSRYIGAPARINDKEYTELNDSYGFIIKQFREFLNDYMEFTNGNKRYYSAKKFRFTTLQYFHKELGIE
jgi:protein AbiQ